MTACVRKCRAMLRPLKVRCMDVSSHLFYSMLFAFHRGRKRDAKYYCSICAIFKDEAPYLREWLEYHLLVGVDHFYLYNNFSSDNYKDILAAYTEKGIVTLVEWPVKYGQVSAYEDCGKRYAQESRWILFLDLDEFVCPTIETSVGTWLKRFERYPAVKMYWLLFGTNGIIDADSEKLVIEQYTCSWAKLRNVGKVAWNTDFVPHEVYHEHLFCKYKALGQVWRLPMVNEARHFIAYPTAERVPRRNTIQLNHYWSKSLREYISKINKGDVLSAENDLRRLDLDFFYWHEHQNVREEKTIFRFLIALKVRMGKANIQFGRTR